MKFIKYLCSFPSPFVAFQTCYELERYLRDEPKLQSYKKLHSELDSWEIFSTPARILEELKIKEQNLDSISTTSSISSQCSGISWDSTGPQSLSCSVVVKKERIDDDEEEHSDNGDDKLMLSHSSQLTQSALQALSCTQMLSSRSSTVGTTTTVVQQCPLTEKAIKLRVVATKNGGLSPHISNGNNHDYAVPTLTPPSSPESIRTTVSSTSCGAAKIDASELAALIQKQQRLSHQQHPPQQQSHVPPTTAVLRFPTNTTTATTVPLLQQQSQQQQSQNVQQQPQQNTSTSAQQTHSTAAIPLNHLTIQTATAGTNTDPQSVNGQLTHSSGTNTATTNIPRSTIVRLTTSNGQKSGAISLARVIHMQSGSSGNISAAAAALLNTAQAAAVAAAAAASNGSGSIATVGNSNALTATQITQRGTQQQNPQVTARKLKSCLIFYYPPSVCVST